VKKLFECYKEQSSNSKKSIDIVLKCYDKLHANANENVPRSILNHLDANEEFVNRFHHK